MNFLFGILLGFIVGIVFSQGRTDPVGDARNYAVRGVQRFYLLIRSFCRRFAPGKPD